MQQNWIQVVYTRINQYKMKRIKRYQAAILENQGYQTTEKSQTKIMEKLNDSIVSLNQFLLTVWNQVKEIKEQTKLLKSSNQHKHWDKRNAVKASQPSSQGSHVHDTKNIEKPNTQNQENEIQKRFCNVNVPIPEFSKNLSSDQRIEQTLVWLGIVCKKVLSTGFSMLMSGQLQISKIKSYCSQNIIRNLIKFSQLYGLSPSDINTINQSLKNDILSYFCLKYPQTQQTGVNLTFSSLLINRDEIDDEQNQLIRKSGVAFGYQQNGIYNSQIMKFFNYIINLPNQEINENNSIITQRNLQFQNEEQGEKFNNKRDLRKCFYEDMESIFTSVYKQSNLIEIHKYDLKKKKSSQIEQVKRKEVNTPTPKTKQQQKKQLQYEQKVKSYTSYQIGQKLPKNMKSFSEYQIQGGNLSLKTSELMRITAKWCEQLWKCFDKKTVIIDRQYPFKMKDGSFRYLDWHQNCMLYALLQRQKMQILQKMKQIQKDNYKHQSEFISLNLSSNLRKFDEDEAIVGVFSSAMFKNYENYLINYLNILIHGIKKVTREFVNFQKVYRVTNRREEYKTLWLNSYQYNQQQVNKIFKKIEQCNKNWVLQSAEPQQIPELITFKIGDLMRCRCSSKQNEVIALYKQVEKISSLKPQLLRIIRVKDRLDGGNKDILINLVYRNTLLIQMQLAIKSQKSKFIENSFKFNHYIYELKRADFGPIMEMCNTWISQDLRSQFYLKEIMSKRIKNKQQLSGKQNMLSYCCNQIKNRNILYLPFRCGVCSTFYFDCNGSQKHFCCNICHKQICYLCHLELSTKQRCEMVKKILPQLNVSERNINQIQFVDKIPQVGGVIINIKSKKKKSALFKTIQFSGDYYLFDCKVFQNSGKIKLIKRFNSDKLRPQFMKQNILITSPSIQKLIPDKLDLSYIKNFYFVPNYLKICQNTQKTSITLQSKDINSDQVFQMQQIGNLQGVTKINVQNNHLKKIDKMVDRFPNVSLLVLNKNQIECIPVSSQNWINLQSINLSQNKIQSMDNIQKISNLVQLNISNNLIQTIEDKFCELLHLKYINLSSNKLTKLPDSFIRLHKLETVVLKGNKIQQLPNDFGQLKNLKVLDIQSNILKGLPESLKNLENLQFLNLNENGLTELPNEIGYLQKLQYLNVGMNKLQLLPQCIGNLKQLQKLLIFSNSLIKLPQSIGNLQKVKQIGARSNKLTYLPESIGNLKSLVSFRMSVNQLKLLPDSIGNLRSLKHFDFSNNKLEMLPKSIGNLQSLLRLRVWINKLQSLPEEIGNLKNLQQLNASENSLTSIPKSVGKLKQLKQFSVYRNKISIVPEQIGNLQELTILKISFNCLESVPSSIGNLLQLRQFLLSENKIRQLPQELTNLQQLRIFRVYSNNIENLPQTIGNLKNLRQFNVSKNKIQTLPESIGNLSELKILKISENQLIKIPDNIGKLKKLKNFDISSNKLESLPSSLGDMEQLTELRLQKNYLLKLPNSIADLKQLKQLSIQSNQKLQLQPKLLKHLQTIKLSK